MTVKSSLTFQILLHLGSYFFGFFCVVEVLMVVYKTIVLPYPMSIVISELILIASLALIEALRMYTGWRGNLAENPSLVGLSVALFVPGVLGVLYLLIWQTYVLRLEMILCFIQLTIQGLEMIFAVICIVSFYGTRL